MSKNSSGSNSYFGGAEGAPIKCAVRGSRTVSDSQETAETAETAKRIAAVIIFGNRDRFSLNSFLQNILASPYILGGNLF
jgi:hypothetical protein